MAEYLIGTQSWQFKGWIGPFYPPAIPPADMLPFYGRVFRTLEIDSTFYGIPAAPVVEGWREAVPPGFQFALKLPQQITHERHLAETDDLLERFLERASLLEDTLGPMLVQLGPDFLPTPQNMANVEQFLAGLPARYRWAMEFRHRGWFTPQVCELLAERRTALVLSDQGWIRSERVFELLEQPTSHFGYVRWMGSGRRFTDYSEPQQNRDEEIDRWAGGLQRLGSRVDAVYGFFNNQFQGHSPHSVRLMQQRLGLPTVEPAELHPQGELFAG